MQSNIKMAKPFEYCKVGHLISSERIAYQKDNLVRNAALATVFD